MTDEKCFFKQNAYKHYIMKLQIAFLYTMNSKNMIRMKTKIFKQNPIYRKAINGGANRDRISKRSRSMDAWKFLLSSWSNNPISAKTSVMFRKV